LLRVLSRTVQDDEREGRLHARAVEGRQARDQPWRAGHEHFDKGLEGSAGRGEEVHRLVPEEGKPGEVGDQARRLHREHGDSRERRIQKGDAVQRGVLGVAQLSPGFLERAELQPAAVGGDRRAWRGARRPKAGAAGAGRHGKEPGRDSDELAGPVTCVTVVATSESASNLDAPSPPVAPPSSGGDRWIKWTFVAPTLLFLITLNVFPLF